MPDTLLKTPLYESHVALGAKIAPFGGWLMPIQYEGIIAEHFYTRNSVSVFDICHMGEFFIKGDAVSSGLDRIVTQDIASMPIGACRYGFMLNEAAGILDDLIIYRLGQGSWMVVVNAATISSDEWHFKKQLSTGVHFENASDRLGKLDVQGPDSLGVIKDIFGAKVEKLRYYSCGDFTFEGESCIISRTGYTGELGYELYVSIDKIINLWNRVLKDKRVKPAGLGARDTLRLEMGYPLYGHELDIAHTPIAACLDKFVDFSKDFIGKGALLDERKAGPKEYLISFKSASRRSPRSGFSLFNGNECVGKVTSGSFSPSLSVGIGMGYVRGEHSIGTALAVKDNNIEIPVAISNKPFYKATH